MSIGYRFKSVYLATSLAISLPASVAFAEPATPEALAQYAVAAETSTYLVRYDPIQNFTNAFGREERGRMKIAYAAVNQQGQRFLEQYVAYLQDVPVASLSRDDQLAFWLNTRNMLIVQAMAESNSRRRLQRTRGTATEPGSMWTEKRITINGTELSIDDIEHGILLANWSDTPNILYGLYQGSTGGAAFRESGFSGANVHAELDAMGRNFVNSRTGVRVRRTKAQIPALYDWYGETLFGGDQAAMIAHLTSLADADTASKLSAASSFETRKFNYSSDELILRQQSAPTTSVGASRGGGGGGGFGS